MKNLIIVFGIAMLLMGCQEKSPQQYFTESAEIDLLKKAISAYESQDWETMKSCYSDTARIWHNVWYEDDPGKSIDEIIELTKPTLANITSYSFESSTYEMIVNDQGNKWVHFWGNWVGTLAGSDQELRIPVHLGVRIDDNQIVYEGGMWDRLPGYIAEMQMQAAAEETMEE